MDVLYLSSVCAQVKFDLLSKQGLIKKLPQAQKYHTLMLEGIRKVIDGELTVISSYPVVGKKKSRAFPQETEMMDGIKFIYLGFYQLPVIRQLCLRHGAAKQIREFVQKHPDAYIICDVLNRSIAGAALSYCKKKHIPICGIVTDVPGHTSDARKKTYSFAKRTFINLCSVFSKGQEEKYDSYLFLTENMNEVLNHEKKPYVVIEGQADIKMESVENCLEKKTEPKVMMYAGGIHKEFGIERFVHAFLSIPQKEWILHIYGDGNYSEDLKKLCAQNTQINYFGVRPNYEIVQQQLYAQLLVNPRFTNAEYVKYSFPSKTMECMASGTPLLTTKLPGMPKDYYGYVYFIENETEAGMKQALKTVMELPSEELFEKGAQARKFILDSRNNVVQAKRLMEFLARTRAVH